MPLILSLGSNLGEKKNNISYALTLLSEKFKLIESSSLYESSPVDYLDQPNFLNIVACYELPDYSPLETLLICQEIEGEMKRKKIIDKGPRRIDIDILFYDLTEINLNNLIIPHPRWHCRAFVTLPLKELKSSRYIEQKWNIPKLDHQFCQRLDDHF